MYAVAVAVYHLCAKNILFYCLNLNLNRKYKKFQLHTILTKKIWILYSNDKLYSYSNSSQKSKILTLAQPIIAQPIIIIIIIHWCCNYLIFYFCSISSLSIPNLKNIFYSSGALWIISQVKLAERSKAPDERMVCADRYTKAFTYAFAGSNPALDE